MIDPLYSLAGGVVGTLIGLTGVGGGSLMTPLLIILFGIHPATAVGTDLLFAACTKSVGVAVHARHHTVDWRVTKHMMAGSIPAAALTILVLHGFNAGTQAVSQIITPILAIATLITAAMLIFQGRILAYMTASNARLRPTILGRLTVATGATLGILVSVSSVGAGAVGVPALTLLYPKMPLPRIVGSDIAHAVPLTLLAGLGYWFMGSVDWPMLLSLLSGSIPGIIAGSLLASRVPATALRLILGIVLAIASLKLLF